MNDRWEPMVDPIVLQLRRVDRSSKKRHVNQGVDRKYDFG